MKKNLCLFFLFTANLFSAVHTVTTVADSGVGSLRQAIIDANADDGSTARIITFNIAPSGVHTITPLTELPHLTTPDILVDGSTQPGFTPNDPQIVIDGTNSAGTFDGLIIDGASNCTIQDLVINNGFNAGISLINSANNNHIYGCFLGIDQLGATAAPNTFGLLMVATGADSNDNNIIGTVGHGNVASGNGVAFGVGFFLSGNLDNTIVEGNFIGTDKTGTASVANFSAGFGIVSYPTPSATALASNTHILNNVISGNSTGPGLVLGFQNLEDIIVQGNMIGVNVTGTAAVPNAAGVIGVSDAVIITTIERVTFGGPTIAQANVVSANPGGGIGFIAETNNSTFQGNFIGTDITGTVPLGNGGGGFSITGSNNLIGGINPFDGATLGQGNLVSNNGGTGLSIVMDSANNIIKGNLIGCDITGMLAMGNTNNGIDITGYDFGTLTSHPSNNNIIGGPATGERNIIMANTSSGILLNLGCNDTIIQNNYIGVDVTGAADFGNGNCGVQIQGYDFTNQITVPSNGTIIGGANANEGNIISASTNQGIQLNVGVNNTVIKGNKIGVDVTGTSALFGNGQQGISIQGYDFTNKVVVASNNTIIGGSTALERNIISSNGNSGIQLNPGVSNTVIQGNYIGVDSTGLVALPNTNQGVQVTGFDFNPPGTPAPDNNTIIGGALLGQRNIISGNGNEGIQLNTDVNNTLIQNNYIGVGVDGTTAIGNAFQGINVFANDQVSCTDTSILSNVISNNGNDGIFLNRNILDTIIQGNFVGTDSTGTIAAPNTLDGVQMLGDVNQPVNNTVIGGAAAGQRNIISSNGSNGIDAFANINNTIIKNNYIGVDATGLVALPNIQEGIIIQGNTGLPSDNTVIGGTTAAERNIVSGNTQQGILIQNNANNTSITGNYIGVGADGETPLGNGFIGLQVQGAVGLPCDNTIIGGSSAGARNVIAANNNDGILLQTNITNTVIQGNYIGITASEIPLSNINNGIRVNDSCVGTIIGGTAAGEGNVIGANGFDGILLQASVTDSIIQGNFIGTDETGMLNLANNSNGVQISGNNGSPSTNNLIGGTVASAGNIIKFNVNVGVEIGGDPTTPDILNPILKNSIFLNGGNGITLVNNGNNMQEAPTVNAADFCASNTNITVTATAPANPPASNFRLEFFLNSVDRNPITEGETFIGAITPVLSGATVSQAFPVPTGAVGLWVSATATNLNNVGGTPGDTSEFSLNTQISSASPVVLLAAVPTTVCGGSSTTFTVTIAGGSAPYDLTWSDGFVQTNVTSPVMRVVFPTQTTTYSVVATDSAGCQGTSNDVTITVPFIDLTAFPTTICEGSTSTLTATFDGDAPFNLAWSDGVIQLNVTSPVIRVVSPTTTTVYSVTLTDASGCTPLTSNNVTITVDPVPTISLTATSPICAGSDATLTATFTGTGPFNLVWSDGLVQTNVTSPVMRTVTPLTTTTYSVTITDGGVCLPVTSNNATVVVNELPFVTLSASQVVVFPGNTVTITAVPSGNGPFTLEWTDGLVQTGVTGPISRDVILFHTTTFNLTIIDVNGCQFDPPMGLTIIVVLPKTSAITRAVIAKYCNNPI